jgi:15-cis-phytoene synthase
MRHMISAQSRAIFSQGSRTYYFSSLFFPEPFKSDVFTLYAFVRTADDFVDATPQDGAGFTVFETQVWQAFAGTRLLESSTKHTAIILDFVAMVERVGIPHDLIRSFLAAMRLDLYKKQYDTIEETIHYMYGSAEVIGLMLVRIFGLSGESEHSARLLGRAMQYINMIRDVEEDLALGRQYLPISEYKKYGIKTTAVLTKEVALDCPAAFCRYLRAQLTRQLEWMAEARRGFHYLPRSLRIPVSTASEMYDWTAQQIWADPMIVWRRQVKPTATRVIITGLRSSLRSSVR